MAATRHRQIIYIVSIFCFFLLFSPTNLDLFANHEAALATTGDKFYVSPSGSGTLNSASFTNGDILEYDTSTSSWSKYFDASDVDFCCGSSSRLYAFHILGDGSLLLSPSGNDGITVPTVGLVDDSDIVRFTPTSLGETTSGTYEMYFDGSDVGLSGNAEDIVGISVLADSSLILTFSGSPTPSGFSGATDEDLLRFVPTSLGATTSGTWEMYLDGSDVGLGDSYGEGILANWVDPISGDIYLTTRGSFSVTGLNGDENDIFRCVPTSIGDTSACTFDTTIFWDGALYGLSGQALDGIQIEFAGTTPSTPTPTPTATSTPHGNRVTSGLLALYDFAEGSGATVTDVSGVTPALNLTITDTNNVTWLAGGGVRIDSSTLIHSGGAATKIIDAAKTNNAFSIEAWVQPANSTQTGPARIVTLSASHVLRNVTLGQQADTYAGRIRTTGTGTNNGLPTLYTITSSADTALRHVVMTWDSAGNRTLYVDGVAQATDNLGGTLSNWDDNYELALGNELGGYDRTWLGTYHLTAVYGRSLSATEVIQNFDAGLSNEPTNNSPSAVDDVVSMMPGQIVNVAPLINDSDPDFDPLTIINITSGSSYITANINQNNTIDISASSDMDFGEFILTYTIDDGNGGTASANILLTVGDIIPPNLPPTAIDDYATLTVGATIVVDVLTNDSDPENDPLTVFDVEDNGRNMAVVNATDNTIHISADEMLSPGHYLFNYSISDSHGGTATATITVIVVSDNSTTNRVTAGLQALYTFKEGNGAVVQDVSGISPALNLTISDTNRITWLENGGLKIDAENQLYTSSPASKIIDAAKASDEVTFEAWVSPENITQGGPARIMSISADSGKRNITLGQDTDFINGRVRTTETNNNGRPDIESPAGGLTAGLHHLVLTRSSDGSRALYIDGALVVTDSTVTGNLSNWDDSYRLTLANEFVHDRAWLGTYYLAAVYGRALSSDEVVQNYTAGLNDSDEDQSEIILDSLSVILTQFLETAVIQATVFDQNGAPDANAQVVWSSSDPAIVDVQVNSTNTQEAIVRANADVGYATITATSGDQKTTYSVSIVNLNENTTVIDSQLIDYEQTDPTSGQVILERTSETETIQVGDILVSQSVISEDQPGLLALVENVTLENDRVIIDYSIASIDMAFAEIEVDYIGEGITVEETYIIDDNGVATVSMTQNGVTMMDRAECNSQIALGQVSLKGMAITHQYQIKPHFTHNSTGLSITYEHDGRFEVQGGIVEATLALGLLNFECPVFSESIHIGRVFVGPVMVRPTITVELGLEGYARLEVAQATFNMFSAQFEYEGEYGFSYFNGNMQIINEGEGFHNYTSNHLSGNYSWIGQGIEEVDAHIKAGGYLSVSFGISVSLFGIPIPETIDFLEFKAFAGGEAIVPFRALLFEPIEDDYESPLWEEYVEAEINILLDVFIETNNLPFLNWLLGSGPWDVEAFEVEYQLFNVKDVLVSSPVVLLNLSDNTIEIGEPVLIEIDINDGDIYGYRVPAYEGDVVEIYADPIGSGTPYLIGSTTLDANGKATILWSPSQFEANQNILNSNLRLTAMVYGDVFGLLNMPYKINLADREVLRIAKPVAGTNKWIFPLWAEVNPDIPMVMDHNRTIYMVAENRVIAIEYTENGPIRKWTSNLYDNISTLAIGAENSIYIGASKNDRGAIFRLDPANGSEVMERVLNKDVVNNLAIGEIENQVETLYVSTDDDEDIFTVGESNFFKINGENGNTIWSRSFPEKINDIVIRDDTDMVYVSIKDDTNKVQQIHFNNSLGWQINTDNVNIDRLSLSENGLYGQNYRKIVHINQNAVVEDMILDDDVLPPPMLGDTASARQIYSDPIIGVDGSVYLSILIRYSPFGSNALKSTQYVCSISPSLQLVIWCYEQNYNNQSQSALPGYRSISNLLVGEDNNIYSTARSIVDVNGSQLSYHYLDAIDPLGNLDWQYGFWGWGDYDPTSPIVDEYGIMYFALHDQLIAVNTHSFGLANSPWPQYNHDRQGSGSSIAK